MNSIGIKEAIDYIKQHFDDRFFDGNFEARSAQKIAISALEKQIPKKSIKKNPIIYQKDKDGHEHYAYEYHCPFCDRKVSLYEHHCLCGQTISW